MVYIPTGTELLDPKKILERVGLKEGMKVADLGCGTSGHFVFAAAEMVGSKGIVYGVDILKSALAGVESKAKMQGTTNVKTVWSDIEVVGATEIEALSIDTVLLVNVHAKEGMIKEAMRLMKSGATLLIVDWSPAAAPFGPPTKDRLSKEEAKKRAEGLGLTLKEEFSAGPYHWGLIFQKS